MRLSVFLGNMSQMDGRMEDFKKKELKELESLGDTELQNGACLVGSWLHDQSHKSLSDSTMIKEASHLFSAL